MALNITSILFGVATFFFVSRLFEDAGEIHFARFGGGYFPYVVVGIATSNFLVSLLNGLAMTLRHEQDIGTLEAIFVSPIPETTALLGLMLWNLFLSLVTGMGYIALGYLVSPLSLTFLGTLKGLLVLALSGAAFLGLGAVAASFILYFKRGNPIAWIFSSLSILLGGVYFPVELLPEYLQKVAHVLPLFYATEALRLSLLANAPFTELWPKLLVLLAFSVLLLPIARLSLHWSLQKTREVGGLTHQ